MVVHEHEIAFGMIDTDFFSTNPVINFFELVVKNSKDRYFSHNSPVEKTGELWLK